MAAPAESDLDTLRFITCGSVDDGKSTLIGRLLYDSKAILEDQLTALQADSKQYGTQGSEIDLALLVDGLQAEREQGITIDVAYRFFSTDKRKFIVADTPGHEQYTRNMATGASTASLAIVLVDARKGLLNQTKRHTRIVAMMGIRHVVLAVNKMDAVAFDAAVFETITDAYRAFSAGFHFASVVAVPMSALAGDNVAAPSTRTAWYDGPTLIAHLNTVDVTTGQRPAPASALRMPVQYINRPHQDFRGVCGRIAAGSLAPGDAVCVLPSGIVTRVKDVMLGDVALAHASEGDSITITLADEVDVSRGDVIVAADALTEIADQFQARLLWMSAHPLAPGRTFLLKIHHQELTATVTDIKYSEDIETGAFLAAKSLKLNEIAVVNLSLSRPVPFEPYQQNHVLGGFILIDKHSFETVGAGMIELALRRASNIHWQAVDIDKQVRAAQLLQTPRCIWFTGLSGSGKSTIANLLEKQLHADGKHTYLLDGDNIRHGLNRDLGFTESDRVENIRRVAEVARLMVDAGLIVLVSFISPYRAEREFARSLFDSGEFLEVYVDATLEECEARDTKGLYAKARRGELKNFTGIDSAYESLEAADIHLITATTPAEASAAVILARLRGYEVGSS